MIKRFKVFAAAVLGVAALAVGGAAIADAASGSSSGSTTTTPAAPPPFPAHGTAAHEDAEQAVTGDAAAKARAAAVTSLGGGTAGEVTTDFRGSGYEVTVTRSDGSTVEVHLDGSFAVVRGPGCPGGGA